MATIKLYNDFGSAHYDCNTPRSLKSVLMTAHKNQLQIEIIHGGDLAWVQQCVKNSQLEYYRSLSVKELMNSF